MGHSHKSKRPPPLDISAAAAAGRRQYSIGSASSASDKVSSGQQLLPRQLRSPPLTQSSQTRTTSYSSDYSYTDLPPTDEHQGSSGSAKSSKSHHGEHGHHGHHHSNKKVASPVNVYTHCGRHSDQFLFSGWGDVVRGFAKRE